MVGVGPEFERITMDPIRWVNSGAGAHVHQRLLDRVEEGFVERLEVSTSPSQEGSEGSISQIVSERDDGLDDIALGGHRRAATVPDLDNVRRHAGACSSNAVCRLRAILICVDPTQLDKKFVGREFDADFLAGLPTGVDPCGERGEFHTFCYRCPQFSTEIPVTGGVFVE